MPRIILEVPEELSDQLAQLSDQLPELLRLSIQQPALPVKARSPTSLRSRGSEFLLR